MKIIAIACVIFILLCSQNIVTDLGLRSMAIVFLGFHILPEEIQNLLKDCDYLESYCNRENEECLERKRKNIVSATYLKVERVIFVADVERDLHSHHNWKIIKKFGVILRHGIHIQFCNSMIFLLFFLPSPDILAEVGWNFRELLSKVSPTLNFSSWLIYGIYIAIFVLSFLNLVITERPYNLHTVHRIIYNYVLILMILWLIILGIRVLSVKIRNHDLECVHSDIEGYCREYIMYDNRTNTHVASRNGEEESASWYN